MINDKTIVEILPVRMLSSKRFASIKYDLRINLRAPSDLQAVKDYEELLKYKKQYDLLKAMIDAEIRECEHDLEIFQVIDEKALLRDLKDNKMGIPQFARLFTIRKLQGLKWIMDKLNK